MSIDQFADPLEQLLAREDEAEAEILQSQHNASTHVTRAPVSYDSDTRFDTFVPQFKDDNRHYATYEF